MMTPDNLHSLRGRRGRDDGGGGSGGRVAEAIGEEQIWRDLKEIEASKSHKY